MDVFAGSITNAFTETSGITLAPVPSIAVHVTVPVPVTLRLVVFQTCLPAMALPLKATYAVFGLVGSMTARAMYFAGIPVLGVPTKVTSLSGLPPLIVAN